MSHQEGGTDFSQLVTSRSKQAPHCCKGSMGLGSGAPPGLGKGSSQAPGRREAPEDPTWQLGHSLQVPLQGQPRRRPPPAVAPPCEGIRGTSLASLGISEGDLVGLGACPGPGSAEGPRKAGARRGRDGRAEALHTQRPPDPASLGSWGVGEASLSLGFLGNFQELGSLPESWGEGRYPQSAASSPPSPTPLSIGETPDRRLPAEVWGPPSAGQAGRG